MKEEIQITDERYKKEYDRIRDLRGKAKTTGKPQLITKWVSGGIWGNSPVIKETVIVLALPDGSLGTYISGDDIIPDFEVE